MVPGCEKTLLEKYVKERKSLKKDLFIKNDHCLLPNYRKLGKSIITHLIPTLLYCNNLIKKRKKITATNTLYWQNMMIWDPQQFIKKMSFFLKYHRFNKVIVSGVLIGSPSLKFGKCIDLVVFIFEILRHKMLSQKLMSIWLIRSY